MKNINKLQFTTSIILLVWIFIINVATPFITAAPPWPMFFVCIFFFLEGAEPKSIPKILACGLIGIFSLLIAISLIPVVAPIFGLVPSALVILFVVLALIFVGGNFAPDYLNNITFAFLTVETIDFTAVKTMWMSWTLMLLIGGIIILAGVFASGKIAEKIVGPESK